MALVRIHAPISEGTSLLIERDLDQVRLTIGQWDVELFCGKLTVRPHDAAINAGRDVLKVDA
jgi:hypothetical protein